LVSSVKGRVGSKGVVVLGLLDVANWKRLMR
jgi:hypothetical protein